MSKGFHIENGSRHDSTGSHWYVNGVEVSRKTYMRHNMIAHNPNPDYYATVVALGVCSNCLCTDCGCCTACGDIDADMAPDGVHGYACIA